MVSEPSVLRPQSMDEMEQQIMFEMSENLQAQKQSTEIIKFQIEKLLQSQAKLQAKLIQSQKNLETMMPRFFSQTSIPLRPPSQPPDPPDFNKSNMKCDNDALPMHQAPFNPCYENLHEPSPFSEPDFTRKADSDFGEETITSNASKSSQVPSQESLYHLPVFDGTLLDCWIVELDRFFELKQYGNEEKLDLISLSLEGAALKWFRRHKREFTDWTDLKRKLMARFGLVKGFVMECEDATMSGGETNVETKSLLEKETIPSSVLCDKVPATQSQDNNVIQQEELVHDTETIMEISPIQEPEPLELADSIMEVDCVHSQEFPSQCQDEEEFIGLNLGKLLKNERLFSIICLLGLNDMSCWTQLLKQQIFPKSWRFKFKTASRESKLLDNNFSGNIKLIKQSSSGDNELIWTQFSSLVKASEMSVLGRDKWKWSEKHRMYNKAWKFKYIQRLMLSVLLQMEQYKLLQGRTINCKMRKKEVLRRIKQSIFIEMQFHMKNNSEFNFQANTRVLELIKDKASRKRKLCKNWWFKYKLSTWFSEALHFWRKRNYEKLQRASEHMMCELIHKIRKACQCVVHETNETASHVWYWWKTKAEIVQILLKPIMHLKGKEETFSFKDAATNCSSKTKISGHILKQVFGRATHGLFLKQSLSQFLLHIQNRDCSFFGYILMATSDCFGTLLGIPDKEIAKPHNIYVLKALILWKWYPPEQATWIFSELIQNSLDLRQFTRVKFYLKHKWRSKFGSSKLTRTLTRQKAWPRVLPRLHVRAFNLSFLRTRMFSTGEYIKRRTAIRYTLLY